MINPRLNKYINDEKYLIYKKDLSYKGGAVHTYYFVIYNGTIVDIVLNRMIDDFIDEKRLSNQNVSLTVYKVVESNAGRYYSFRWKGRMEYILNISLEVKEGYGMFFCKSKDDLQHHFFDHNNRVVLMAKTTIDDIIGTNERDVQLKRVTPIAIE